MCQGRGQYFRMSEFPIRLLPRNDEVSSVQVADGLQLHLARCRRGHYRGDARFGNGIV